MAKKHNTRKFNKTAKTSAFNAAESGSEMSKFVYLFGDAKGETKRLAVIDAYVPKDVEGYRKFLVKRGMRLLDDAKGADKTVTQFQVYLVSDEWQKSSVKGNIFYDPEEKFSSDEKKKFTSIKEDFEDVRNEMHENAAKKAAAEAKPTATSKKEVKVAASKGSAATWTPKASPAKAAAPAVPEGAAEALALLSNPNILAALRAIGEKVTAKA